MYTHTNKHNNIPTLCIALCGSDVQLLLDSIKLSSIHIIQSTVSQPIRGLTTLNSQLFIVRKKSQRLHIHNTTNFTKTGYMIISTLISPRDLIACLHYNCVYISDYWFVKEDTTKNYYRWNEYWSSRGYIHRVELSDRSVTRWSVNE